MQWLDDPLKYDVLQAKQVLPVCGIDILKVPNGMKCAAMFQGSLFNIKVISSGKKNTLSAHA